MQAFFTLLSKIQKEEFAPFYLLSGNEPYYIDTVLNTIENKLVEENARDFDFTQFYGKEVLASEIIETAKRYPMLSKYNLVIIKEAQFMNASEYDLLTAYASQPMPQTVVVFCYKNKEFDKRKKLYKAVEKTGEILTVKPLYENQLIPWIHDRAKDLKLEIVPEATALLAAYIGADLFRLDSELKKLKIALNQGDTVNLEHIEKYVGVSKAFNSFELQKAIGLGQLAKAFQIIQYINRNPKEHPLVVTLATLYNYFQKLLLIKGLGNNPKQLGISPYFFKEYQAATSRFTMRQLTVGMEHILDADLKSKGIISGKQSSQEIMEELLLKLFSL